MEDRGEPQTTSSDETASQFKTIVTHVVDGVLVVDMAGTVRFANPAAEALLARTSAELIGTNLGQPVVAGESTEITLIRKNDRPATVELRAAGITWEGAPAMLASLRDISELRQQQVAREVSEAQLARAQRVAKLGHWEWNLSRQELTCSDEIYRIFELDRGTPLSFDGIASLIHPEDRARNQAFVNGILAGGERAELQVRLLLPDARIKHVLQFAEVHRDDAGEPDGVIGTMHDETARRQAEETLSANEARYRSYIDATGQIGWVTNPNGEVVKDVPSLRQFSGLTLEEMKGFGWTKALHPDDVEQTLQAWNSAVATKSAYEVEYRMRRHDGVYRHLLARGSPVLRADGTTREWVGTCIDITERKRVEEALRESESEFRTLAEAMPQIVWITRPDGWNIFFNQQWMDYTGLSLEESLGHGWNIPFHPDDRQRAWDAWNKATSQNCIYSIESRLRRADGAYRWWLVRGVPKLDAAGNIIKWYGTCTDIHDLKMAEQGREDMQMQLQASQKMEAIGSLAGGVAHDFNNLLSVILSYTGFAMEGVRDGDPLKDDLLEVKKAGERAVALTRQLLAFSRKQVLQPVTVSLNQIATGVENMLRRILGEDIDFVQILAPDLGVVKADLSQIEQVLMNLVVNARDAMPEGGELTIETSNVEVDEEYAATHVAVMPGSYVQLAVTDTGCGMDEQTRARIFEPFFTTKEKGKGTGLGLPMVYGIVKQSGGNIWVYSELGLGTTFKIYLPRELSATTATVVRSSTAPMRSKGTETILVVEDEEALRKVAKRSLAAAGYRVLTASDGRDALLVSAEHAGEIQLLLTDVVMPRMSGRAVARELLKTRPTLKVVYMSGYTDDAVVHHGVLDAGVHFLAKPFTSADLTRKAREVLDSGITNFADGHEQPFKDEAEKKEHPLDKAALRLLPPDVRARLRQAVIAARYAEIVTIIETIRVTEPNVATELRRMADLFDYDGMRGLLSDGTESQRGR